MKWAEGLDVPTIDQNPAPEILWWVGCAPSTDARAQKTARALAAVLKSAGVNYAVLGQHEQCTGDSARRAGNEYLFFELATANVEMLNEVAAPRILTTCPHCMHTLETEYPEFGGNYDVVHHTEYINELITAGRLQVKADALDSLTYHDPCYLGRQNSILIEPREILQGISGNFVEMAKNGQQSFCCGAGGAQMWKEEEEGHTRVSSERIRQAQETGADTLAVGCPFCMIMLTDAAKAEAPGMQLLDVAEIVAANLED
jgi:Fe-S oxidoreductase